MRALLLAVTALALLALVWHLYFWRTLLRSSVKVLQSACSDEISSAYLDDLVSTQSISLPFSLSPCIQCRDYLNGVVGGSLCEPLCVRREVEFEECLGHGVKMHVLKARWGANALVLKAAKPVDHERATSHLQRPDKFSRIITKQEFLKEVRVYICSVYIAFPYIQANETLVMNMLGGGGGGRGVRRTVERVFYECDVLGDGVLSYSEALVCWSLLETDEFVLLSLLRGLSPVPDIYGACGNMYATQYATSAPLLAYTLTMADNRTWTFRARLAIALIEMVASFENTSYGTLYLCDVQESNFGIVRSGTSQDLVAKTIDLDISWFERGMTSSVQFERDKSCTSDDDCDFISCHVPCDTSTHTCAGKLWSNNLQVYNTAPSI